MQISVVIPLFNEAESLPELMQWIDRVMQTHNYSYEVIMVEVHFQAKIHQKLIDQQHMRCAG